LPIHFDKENEDDDFEVVEIEDEDVDLEEEAAKVEVDFNIAVISAVIFCDKVLFINPQAITDN
jgi:hypothetical protein